MGADQLLRNTGLDAVVGMYPVVHRVRSIVVAPWVSSLGGDTRVRPPRSVLLYGPAGCGVAFIAERLADELETAAGAGTVVVSDLDAMASADPDEAVAVFDGATPASVVMVGVSHAPWDLPAALLDEAGGIERLAFVPPPDWDARRFRLWETSWGRTLDADALDTLVAATEGWTGRDIADLATDRPAVDQTPAHAAEWLARARSMLSAMPGRGRFDDLTGYLQRYRLL